MKLNDYTKNSDTLFIGFANGVVGEIPFSKLTSPYYMGNRYYMAHIEKSVWEGHEPDCYILVTSDRPTDIITMACDKVSVMESMIQKMKKY